MLNSFLNSFFLKRCENVLALWKCNCFSPNLEKRIILSKSIKKGDIKKLQKSKKNFKNIFKKH
jgi:hypothetical protein